MTDQLGTTVADLWTWINGLMASADEIVTEANALQSRGAISAEQRDAIEEAADGVLARLTDIRDTIPPRAPATWETGEVFALSDAVAEELSALRVRVGLAPVERSKVLRGETGVGLGFGILAAVGIAALVWMFRSR